MIDLLSFIPTCSKFNFGNRTTSSDVNSENSNIVLFWFWNLRPPEGKLQRCQFLRFFSQSLASVPAPDKLPAEFRVLIFLSFTAVSYWGFVRKHLRSRDASGTLNEFPDFDSIDIFESSRMTFCENLLWIWISEFFTKDFQCVRIFNLSMTSITSRVQEFQNPTLKLMRIKHPT